MTKNLRLLHTSDWHLGRLLYGRKRYAEFAAFLDWLLDTLRAEGIDVLLVAGDIFDTTTPSNAAQTLYYRFLRRVAATGCRHVVVIGGNHDSPTFLDAPAELLKMLDVHVVGAATDSPAEEVITLRDPEGAAELLLPPYDESLMQQDYAYVVKKLGFASAEFESIMGEVPRSYRDYPNNSNRIRILKKAVNAMRARNAYDL